MLRQLIQPLRGGRHLLGLCRKNVTKRDVRGTRRQRDIHFHIVMGGNAKAQSGVADGAEVGGFQILLA